MTRYSTLAHPMMPAIAWDPARPAEWINDHIAMVHATSNSYVIVGDDGDVIVNTATVHQAARTKEKFEELLGRPLKPAKIIFTQSHPDHTGGWEIFADAGTETLVQREFARTNAERKLLGGFFGPRNARVLAALIPPNTKGEHWFDARDPEPLTTFAESLDFTFSGRRYRLFTLSSGETVDSLGVWLPDEKTLFFGNWAGAIMGAFPNFYTARGDRDRSITRWIEHCDQMIALAPELLITGHDQPIRGAAAVKAHLTKLRDAVRHIHDETVKGMGEGRALADLRQSITLPAALQTNPGRGPIDWYVRTVWEEYAGWFHHDLTSELYAEPASTIWPELAELAGGADALAARARDWLAKGEPVKALHFIEIALEAAPASRQVQEVALAIYDRLADDTEGKHFDLLGWLEGRIIGAKAALGES